MIGGVAYLAALTEGLPRRLSIEEYVCIVKDKSLLRQTIAESDRVGTLAGDQSGSAEEVLAEAESAFRRIAGQAITSGLTSVGEYVKSHYPRIDEIFEQSARLTGIASGFWCLDHLTAGFQPKELTILGARPSIGKTAVAGNIAVHVAMSGKTVAFFSLEMPSKALIDRMCCAQRAGGLTSASPRPVKRGAEAVLSARAGRDYRCAVIYRRPAGADRGVD